MLRGVPIADRFWARVDKDGPIQPHCFDIGACWERLSAGAAPRFADVRKLLRLSDERRDIALEQKARIDAALAILMGSCGPWYERVQRAANALSGVKR